MKSYLDPFQSGFRTQLLTLMDYTYRKEDLGNATPFLLLGISVAFDTLSHAHAQVSARSK